MERQIKFRAWHKGQKEMFYPNCSKNVKGYLGLNKKQIFEKFNDDELMQFTGLKDKNGVDIYEGDILSGYPHGNSIVKWDDEYGCWHSGFDLIGNEIKDMPEREVIGNIYENPNLLQDGK